MSYLMRRTFSTFQAFKTRNGNIKLSLTDQKVTGVAQGRGARLYQEDSFGVYSLELPGSTLQAALYKEPLAKDWNPSQLDQEKDNNNLKQVSYFAVFDGHGGEHASRLLRDNLHRQFELSNETEIPETIDLYRKTCGQFYKRYRGGSLARFHPQVPVSEHTRKGPLGLDELAVLAFLKEDLEILRDPDEASGAVGTVALLHSLTSPVSLPPQIAPLISLTIAHLGDVRAILAGVDGKATRVTEAHHPESRSESERLRRTGTGIITDSFGENRYAGRLANTRAWGDRAYKGLGVFAEPTVKTRVLNGEEWSFLAIVSDGVTDYMSDQELVDLTRGQNTPGAAAKKILSFAESVGAQDNLTVMVIPLLGWGKMTGSDQSAARRKYRLGQASITNTRMSRM